MSLSETRRRLADIDVFHLHWPEYFFGFSLFRHREVIEAFREAGVPVVWTAHDATPHNYERGSHSDVYALWAEAATGVIHHSHWGKDEIKRRYRFRSGALHRVIAHGAWTKKVRPHDGETREAAERHFGLSPATLRIGVHGGFRPAKDVQLALDGFAASSRPDLRLLVACLNGESVPADSRITAWNYRGLPEPEFRLLLQAIDVFLLPFREGGSTLTTGLPFDAIGLGRPLITSRFPYLTEVLGDAAIVYGDTAADLTACLNGLDEVSIRRSAAASVALQKRSRWKQSALQTLAFLEEVKQAC